MKRIIVITAALFLLTAGISAQNGKSIYNKYSDSEEVSAVYISSTMFRMMGRIPNMNMGNGQVNLGSIINDLDAMYVLDCDEGKTCAELKEDVNKYIKKYEFELLMEIKDKGEVVKMYTAGNEKTVTHFIMTAAEKEAFTFICLDGTMSRAELEKLIAKATQEMQ